MANPIKKDELVTDEALGQLKLMADRLTIIAENLTKAKEACQSWGEEEKKNSATTSNNVEELSKMSARITQLEDAIKKLNAAEKENENARRAVNEQKRLYRKLTDDEIKSVEDLKRALAGSVEEQMAAVKAIDTEKKSYNELQQTYNALKDTLNKLTTEQRNNTDAGRAMTASALKIRDTMNELQKATGNYTLQVGKYKAAFDGLGFSFMQILREAPSALNLNQFFLAISNNLPLFFDQVTAYTKSMKTELAQLQAATNKTAEETARMAELTEITGNKVKTFTAVVKRLGTAMFSLQGAVLAFTLLLRFLPKIVNWFKELANKVDDSVNKMRRFREIIADININVDNSLDRVRLELVEINKRLATTTKGTEEWKNEIARVNEIIGSTLNDISATPEEVDKITKAYLRQQEQLAKNRFVLDKITESANNETKRMVAIDAMVGRGDVHEVANALGFTEGSEEYKEIDNIINGKIIAAPGKKGFQFGGGELLYEVVKNRRKRTPEEQKKAFVDFLDKVAPIMDEQQIIDLWERYYKALPEKPNGGGRGAKEKQFDFSPSDVDDEYWKAEQARIRMMEKGYDMEVDLQRVKHEEMLEQNDVWQGKREEQLMDNLMGELTLLTNGNEKAAEQMFNAIVKNDTEAVQQMSAGAQQLATKFWSDVEEGQRQHDLIMQGLIIDNNEAIKAINQKYDKQQMDAIQEQYKSEMRVVARRNKTIVQEQQKNADLAYNINVLRQEMEALTTAQYKDNDSKEEAAQRAAALSKEIEKLQKQIDHTKQLSNYSSVGDIFRRNVGVGAGTQQSLMESILGKDAYSAFAPGSKELQDAIEKDFDTWMKSAEQTISTWYSTTMGYINDLISAYVELANAKAEAAAEATEAAQEEYDKEKALLEAGYASRVEATWAEYQEKKAAQEKAEADAKAAAKAQQDLNQAEAMGSLIVASANIWKTFSKIPTVGVPLALAALATMWGSFLQAKVKAAEVSKYGEGGFEVLEGGSHASGHDIDLGVNNRKGRRMRAEGKEGLGIFSRRAMSHYGASNIEAMVNSVNRLEFEGNAAKRMSIERSVGMQILSMPRTDLHRLESGMDKLVSYGARSIHHNPDGTVVETRKNARIVYKNI